MLTLSKGAVDVKAIDEAAVEKDTEVNRISDRCVLVITSSPNPTKPYMYSKVVMDDRSNGFLIRRSGSGSVSGSPAP